MAHIHQATARNASRQAPAHFAGSLASLSAHAVFVLAVAFAAAIVLGLVP